MERDLLDHTLIKAAQVVNSLVPIHEKVCHWILVVSLDSLGHFFCQTWEPHRNHEVVFNL